MGHREHNNLVDLQIVLLSDSMEFEVFQTRFTGLQKLSSVRCVSLAWHPHWDSLPSTPHCSEGNDFTAFRNRKLARLDREGFLPSRVKSARLRKHTISSIRGNHRTSQEIEEAEHQWMSSAISEMDAAKRSRLWGFKVSHIPTIFVNRCEVSAPATGMR